MYRVSFKHKLLLKLNNYKNTYVQIDKILSCLHNIAVDNNKTIITNNCGKNVFGFILCILMRLVISYRQEHR